MANGKILSILAVLAAASSVLAHPSIPPWYPPFKGQPQQYDHQYRQRSLDDLEENLSIRDFDEEELDRLYIRSIIENYLYARRDLVEPDALDQRNLQHFYARGHGSGASQQSPPKPKGGAHPQGGPKPSQPKGGQSPKGSGK